MHKVRFQSGDLSKPLFDPTSPSSRLDGATVELDDDDDEVFDASEDDDDDDDMNGHQSKPLMHRRHRAATVRTVRPAGGCGQSLRSVIYFVVFGGAMVTLALFVVYTINTRLLPATSTRRPAVGSRVAVADVWVTGLPKLTTQSALRLVDVNLDGVLDVLLGFATGAAGHNVPDVVCVVYFNNSRPCLGGLLVLDGRTGHELWRHYTRHEVFALNCNEDLDADGTADCLLAGRSGTFEAVSVRARRRLWTFGGEARVAEMNLYTPLYVSDVDADGVPDIVSIHGGDPAAPPGDADRLAARIILLSGRDGSVLRWMEVPEGKESYFSPVSYRVAEAVEMILIGTGGETIGGALWCITLSDLYKGDIHKAREIYRDDFKGVMTPPVLVDLTGDGVVDIVTSSYNSSVLAYDGATYRLLWNFTQPAAESYATPAPGYYNDDDIPDFLVQWQHGPGYPIYYYSTTTILDGKTGKALLKPYIRSSIGTQVSPLTVSMKGKGNDLFLYWLADCKGHEGQSDRFQFAEGTDFSDESRTDFCHLRFQSKGYSKLYALSQHLKVPGVTLYNSAERVREENAAWVDTEAEGSAFLRAHPQMPLHPRPPSTHTHREMAHETPVSGGSQSPIYTIRKHGDHSVSRHHQEEPPQSPPQSREAVATRQRDRHAAGRPDSSDRRRPTGDTRSYDATPTGRAARPAGHQMSNQLYGELLELMNKYKGNGDGMMQERERERFGEPQWERRQTEMGKSGRFTGLPSTLDRPYMHREEPPRRGFGRGKRDTAAYDHGVQRLISTGTLAPPLLPPSHPDYEESIDVVFATDWFYPADTRSLLNAGQQLCVKLMMDNQTARFDPTSVYYKLNEEAYRERVMDECSKRGGATGSTPQMPRRAYDPYHIRMGQMTIYRIRLKFTGATDTDGVLPFSHQRWAAYMGSAGDGHWHNGVLRNGHLHKNN